MNCAIALVPEVLLDGQKLIAYEYIGLRPLIELLDFYEKEIDNLKEYETTS